ALESSGGDIAYGDWTAVRFDALKAPAARPRALAQVDDQALRALSGVWYPPHLYLVRRAAAERLQAAAAWRPGRPVGTDIEYSATAALMGLRFRHVAGARVQYNIWSDGQISGGTPYAARVTALKAIFADLRAFAATAAAGARLGRAHRTLLNQNWDVWRLPPRSASLTRSGERLFR